MSRHPHHPASPIRIVVLGTGTDVGKTYFSCALATALGRAPNSNTVVALKPIESGIQSRAPEGLPSASPATDATRLGLCSIPQLRSPRQLYGLPDPVSPHLAARRAGVSIEIDRILQHLAADSSPQNHQAQCATQCTTLHAAQTRDWLIIETAGAAFTPLAATLTNMNLACALEPAIWILVAPDKLGVLHDLTTTLFAMRELYRGPDHVVLSQTNSTDESTGSNAEELKALSIANPSTVLSQGGALPNAFIELLQSTATSKQL